MAASTIASQASASGPCFAANMQISSFSSPLRFSTKLSVRPIQLVHSRRLVMSVRAASQKPEQQSAAESTKMNPAEADAAPAKPAANPGVSSTVARKPSFWDVMAFSGAAPETINGRLAMVGFLSALAVEAQRGEGLLAQIGESQGLQWFLLTSAIISAASLVPMLKGVSRESRSGSIMSVQAETWNGRAAMLGLVALALTEFFTKAPLV